MRMERKPSRLKIAALLLVFAITCGIFVSACGRQNESGGQSLDYSTGAQDLILFADENTTPGGYAIGQECNHVPRLRIWGDGRTIYSDIQNSNRRVLVGQTTPEQINAILQRLADAQYFTKPPENTFDSSGNGYRIGIKLKGSDSESFWSKPNEIYPLVVDQLDLTGLSDFIPTEGYLVIGPRLRKEVFTSPPDWPSSFNFRLADEDASGRVITGEPLDFLWQAINKQPEPLTGVRDGDAIYAVAVFVDGVSLGTPPFKCWNK